MPETKVGKFHFETEVVVYAAKLFYQEKKKRKQAAKINRLGKQVKPSSFTEDQPPGWGKEP